MTNTIRTVLSRFSRHSFLNKTRSCEKRGKNSILAWHFTVTRRYARANLNAQRGNCGLRLITRALSRLCSPCLSTGPMIERAHRQCHRAYFPTERRPLRTYYVVRTRLHCTVSLDERSRSPEKLELDPLIRTPRPINRFTRHVNCDGRNVDRSFAYAFPSDNKLSAV